MTSVAAVLLAFNQAAFVRDAVRDLFAQDIGKMDVILSDDCSSDATFDILQEEARHYRGPFSVSVRRSRRNAGMNAHINDLVASTSAEIIIPFAGDDRFEPTRARRLVTAIRESGALLAHSSAHFIDAQGHQTKSVHQGATFYHTTDPTVAAQSDGLFIGATAAWERGLFTRYGPLPLTGVYEDLVLGFRAALEGRVVHVPEPLMSYRVGVGLSSKGQNHADRNAALAGREEYLRRRKAMLEAHHAACLTNGMAKSETLPRMLEREIFRTMVRVGVQGGIANLAVPFLRHPRRTLRVSFDELGELRRLAQISL